MVRIRLMRMGKKKQPIYRLVAAESRKPRDGRFLDILGHYKPLEHPSEIRIDEERALAWLEKGAQPSEQALALLKRSGIWSKHVAAKREKAGRQKAKT